MSWLRDHFHNFVFPAFMAAGKKTTDIGEPFDVRPSPHAPEKLPSELKKLWTLCHDNSVPWEYDVRELNAHGGTSKYREKARVDHEVLNTTLDSAMAAMRQEDCDRLFLGGRDVWAFAVMCERRRIPYLYVPELSRYVSSRPEVKGFLEERGFRGERELFLDTGYAGSIPRNLAAHFPGQKFKFRLMSQSEVFVHTPAVEGGVYDSDKPPFRVHKQAKKERWKRFPNQLFPNRKTAREEAMFQEYVAKYQKSGTFSEPMKTAPIGHAPSVFKEWLHRPKTWRYDDPQKRMFCLTDGKDAVGVGLNDVKMVPGFYEWWKSLPKGPVWVPPDHSMGCIVQYFSDVRTIQRAALLTSQLWRGIPSWKAMAVEKPKVNVYMGGPVLNTAGISKFTVGGNGILVDSNSTTSTITYTNSTVTGNLISLEGVKANGFHLHKGEDKGEDQNGMPTIELTKAQLDLFGPAILKKAEKLADEKGQFLLQFPPPPPEVPCEMPFPAQAGCGCGPEEACSECPDDKLMTEDAFSHLHQITVT